MIHFNKYTVCRTKTQKEEMITTTTHCTYLIKGSACDEIKGLSRQGRAEEERIHRCRDVDHRHHLRDVRVQRGEV